MAEIYEFHVAGLVGPVVRSALPELATGTDSKNSVLSGIATGPDEVDRVLQTLGDAGMTATHIVISRNERWQSATASESDCSGGTVPVVDDDGSQYDVLD